MRFFTGIFILSMLRTCGIPLPVPRASTTNFISFEVRQEKQTIPILTYHRFGTTIDLTSVTPPTFEYQLDYLAEHGYTVIPLHALVDWMRGAGPQPPQRSVVITADDGHASVYTEMLPIVRRHHIPITLFIYPSAISNASYALTWNQLEELKKSGLFDIQSHTYWHPNFRQDKPRLSQGQYQQFVGMQLSKSKQELETRLHTPVDLLAWPFGIYDEFLITKAMKTGYIAAFGLGSRRVEPGDPIMALPRYLVTESDKGTRFQAILGSTAVQSDPTYFGTITDGITQKPIERATVTLGNTVTETDSRGAFRVSGDRNSLRIRAPGYRRLDVDDEQMDSRPLHIELTPFKPKAVYLSVFGIGSSTLREPALRLMDLTELNALVIDVKGDRGFIPFKTSIKLAEEIGAEKEITVRDIRVLMQTLRRRGIYTIARIVVFKDDPLASSRHDLAVKSSNGQIWHDGEHLAWTDPFNKEVWDYNIDIAVEAAKAGFDEIQFDYVRFPDARGLAFSAKDVEENRVNAISGFLREARKRLIPYNVFLSVDMFGYVCWNLNDTGIGQKLEELAPEVDYISPMLYPSGFQFGIPGFANPLEHPHEIVYLSLQRALERTHLSSVHFRPWLQAFDDYAFDRRSFGAEQIRTQIDAAEQIGSDGWMLWNPHNIYSAAGLRAFEGDLCETEVCR